MKKLFTTMVLLLALIIVGKAQTPLLSENFNAGLPDTWTTIDADGDGHDWHNMNMVGHSGNEGDVAITSQSYLSGQGGGPLHPDNWLITPSITIPSTGVYELTFWVCAQDASYPAEHYGVYITTSTTGIDNPSNYTLLFEETIDANGGTREQGAWKMKTQSLQNYAGQTIHIAFRHFNVSDQFYINLDDVCIDIASTEPSVTVNANSIQFPTGTVGSNFGRKNFAVSGINLNQNIVLSLPNGTPFGISTDTVNFSNTATLTPGANGTVSGIIYVNFTPSTVGYFNANINITSQVETQIVNLEGMTVDCSQYQTIPWYENFGGDVFPPACWVIDATDSIVSSQDADGTLHYEYTWFKFGAGAAVRGDDQNAQDEHFYSPTFDLSNASGAADLSFGIRTNPNIDALVNGDITMRVRLSTDGGITYSTLWDIQDCIEEYSAVWNSNWPIWPVSHNMDQYIGSNSLLKLDFYYAAPVGAAVQFIFTNLKFNNFFDPRLDVNAKDTINFFTYVGNPEMITIPVEGRNITNSIQVNTTAPFEVSVDGNSFATTATLPATGGNFYLRYNPTVAVIGSLANLTVTASTADTTLSTTIVLMGDSHDCSNVVLPISQSFESEDGTVLAPNTTEYCWLTVKANTSDPLNNIVNSNDYAYTGNLSFRFSSTNYNAQQIYDQYLISPELNANNTMLVMFNYANASALLDETFCVGYSTTGNAIEDFTWEADIVNSANTDWQLYRNISVPANVKYVAIHYKSLRKAFLYIDNFQIMEAPTCMFPVELRAENTATDHADLMWAAGNTETSWEMVYSVAPLNLETATPTTVNTLGTTINGLTANTHYQAAVRAICGNGHSEWSEIADFWTTTTPATIPYTQTFEDNDADRANWVLVNGNEANFFAYGNIPGSTTGKALMITKDGVENTYLQAVGETMVSHYSTVWAYRDLQFPETTAAAFKLTLRWKCFGEVNYDFGEMFIGNATEVTNFERNENIPGFIDVNTSHYTPAGLTKLARFENKAQMQNGAYLIPAEMVAGQVKRLYFLWTNDSLSGAETPLAVDNIDISIPQFSNITGTVTDANTGTAIAGASISMVHNDGFTANATTDANGNYSIHDVVFGYYTITINASGYQTMNTGYSFAPGDNNVNFQLDIEECAIIPSNVVYTIEDDNMLLTWNAVKDDTLQLCSDNIYGYLGGSSTSYNCGAAHLYTPSDLTVVNGGTITEIGVMVHCDPQYCDYTVRIYLGGSSADGPASMTPVYEQAITPEDIDISGWTNTVLNEPFVIDGTQNLWIGYYAHVHDLPQGGTTYYPLWITEDCSHPGYSNLLLWNGAFEQYDKDFLIRATVKAPSVTYNILSDGNVIATNINPEDLGEEGYVISPYDPTACYQVTTTCENGETSNPSECASSVSINDVNASNNFEVYPNPAHETVTVSTTMNAQKVEVLNYLGQVIYTSSVSSNNFTLNVANYADGVYFIRLTSNEGIATQKLIKK